MALDTLILGGFAFDSFSTPEHIPFGGDHAMVVHKLPGGQRVIDTLGPDDMDIAWHGRLWGDNALGTANALDALRRSGVQLPLAYAGRAYTVVIATFEAEIERLPMNVLYHIRCVVAQNASVSALGGAALAAADLAAAAAL
ncbi:MAG: hypothetical protein ACR652_00815 [Methylocystis sp.]|uniref:hypothetical protein n=1 Tax=Methylocystis sp. TaxID=1911079 RepID=UPI003DA57519